MNEKQEREQSLQPMYEQASALVVEMGETPEQRLEWFNNLDHSKFSELLININATARCLPSSEHQFDGDNVKAGTVGGSVPPEQDDKLLLLGELLDVSKEHVSAKINEGHSPEDVWKDVAMTVPVIINKLHLFANGNGRTSRFMRMAMLSTVEEVESNVAAVVQKKPYESFDATPIRPVDQSVLAAMRSENTTEAIKINDDVDDDEVSVMDGIMDSLRQDYPDVDSRIITAYEDSRNFNETVRLIAKDRGIDSMSLRQFFNDLNADPNKQQLFRAVYAGVRKQRVEMLMKGLYGEIEIPVDLAHPPRSVDPLTRFINDVRQKKGLDIVDPGDVKTIRDFQMRYMDAQMPKAA